MKRTSLPLLAPIKRRSFIALLAGAEASPLAARAQEPAAPIAAVS
jgi:hypothetical protein